MADFDMTCLDYLETMYDRIDPSQLRHRLKDLPRQCREGWSQAMNMALPDLAAPIRHVVVGGMGGSAIAGDLVADLAAIHPTVPINVVRGSRFPFNLDQNTLFIGCSYSGETSETLSLFRQAQEQNAQVMAITAGGVLAEEALARGVPLFTVNASGEPRSAIGYSLMSLLGVLHRRGIVNTKEEEIDCALSALSRQLAQLGEDVPSQNNPAKQLAWELKDHLIIIYGGGLFAGMARRWKTQLNENSKMWAYFETVPELLHNSVEAYSRRLSHNQNVFVLVLQPEDGDDELEHRFQTTCQLLEEMNVPHRILKGVDGPPLTQLLTVLSLGDYVSYYLAILQELDPSPVTVLSRGKAILNELASDT